MNPLLSTLAALVVGGVALFYGLPMMLDAQMQPAQDDAGNQIAQMQAAGASYIRNHASTLVSTITVGTNIQIVPGSTLIANSLIGDGDLPSSFIDGNVFGQKHVLSIAQPSAGVLEGMVYTYGGDTIIDAVAIRVAEAGPPNATVVLSTDATNFEGAAGGEAEAISVYQNANYPVAVGHIGAHIEAANYAAESPFLNRYATGNVDDNTMHTAQYMIGNSLNMGSSSSATSGGGDINMAAGNIKKALTAEATQYVQTPKVQDPDGVHQVTPAGSSEIDNLQADGNVTVTGTVKATIYSY